jgi:hypothetical protein
MLIKNTRHEFILKIRQGAHLLVAVLVIYIVASAQTLAASSEIIGMGREPCPRIIQSYQEPGYRGSLLAWLSGYLSGINTMLVERDKKFHPVEDLTSDFIIAKVVVFCSTNPAAIGANAADSMFRDLPLKQFSN